ncbi:hypothetical protein, partial [Marinoscillum pacificum]|uniref:hypothetical protein n=1 Tax=Marinoscillum pacificum TaxID=392723 RepID=UPI00215738FA
DTATDIRADLHAALIDSANDVRSDLASALADSVLNVRLALTDSTSAIRTDMASMQSQIDAATTPSLSDVLSMGTDANASSITNINGISVNGSTSLGDDIATDNLTVNSTIQGNLTFEGSSSDGYAVTLAPGTGDANYTVTLPDATTTLVGTDNNQTLSNKTLTAININPNNEDVNVGGTVITVGSRSLINVNDGDSGSNTSFTISNGTKDGQMLILILVASANSSSSQSAVILSDSGNTMLNGDWGPDGGEVGSTLTIMWNAYLNAWVELNRSIN